MDLIELVIVLFFGGLSLYRKKDEVMKLVTDKNWLLHMSIIALFSIFIFNREYVVRVYDKLTVSYKTHPHKQGQEEETKTKQEAIKKSLFALMIAVFAYLDLTIAPFWLAYFVYINLGDEWIA
jgi:hypothetical protein